MVDKMKVGIAVFAYNRNQHLSKTLNGLKTNKEVNEIYVFQDGLKTEEHRNGWEATKKVISDIDWCNVNYILSDINKGLAKSIVDGINLVLLENDAVIVLEDDCVPSPNFINFMYQCFEKYENNKSVYSVSGYSWPIDIEKDEHDVYFTGRISSWGWGTWKDRWNKYDVDNQIVDRLKHDKKDSVNLAMWGNDLESMLKDRIASKNDSWAVYWALKVIEMNGKCVVPYTSLIDNIGCDGSGVHCGVTDRFITEIDITEKTKIFALPDNIYDDDKVALSFASLYGSYTAVNHDTSKKKVLIYGFGNYFKANEKYINDNFYIEAFIDRVKDGYYAGKKIIKLSQIISYTYDSIIIMLQDIQESMNVAKMLKGKLSISESRILIGGCKFEE
jgi:hypothetical protein